MVTPYQEYLAWTYFSRDALDAEEFSRMARMLEGVTRFIDVGASHGAYTYHANRILTNAQLFAIEADPERFAILKANAARWAAESSNQITCINAAASDFDDRRISAEVDFQTTGTQVSGGIFAIEERSDNYRPIRVPIICVDDLFEPAARTFVKIDVEGAELRVLRGAAQHIAGGQTSFFVEISWWGDRQRHTSSLDVLRFAYRSRLRVDRRLLSDYLMSPESSATIRLGSIVRCLPPLILRLGWNRFVPSQIRKWRERRLLQRRLARFMRSTGATNPTQ